MFDRLFGLPAHPLLVHAAVVFLPLLAAGGVAYALAPFTRRHIRWPVIFLAIAAPGAVFAAKLSGDSLAKHENLTSAEIQGSISGHADFGDVTMWLAIALGLVVLALTFAIPVRSARASRHGDPDDTPTASGRAAPALALQVAFGVVTVGLAGASVYYVFKTGDSGAKMVWSGY